jgi:hypothetical protein
MFTELNCQYSSVAVGHIMCLLLEKYHCDHSKILVTQQLIAMDASCYYDLNIAKMYLHVAFG